LRTVEPDRYVVPFKEIDHTQVPLAGGKGAHLGELARMDGLRVPPGFCITTHAFRRMMAAAPSIGERLDALSRSDANDAQASRTLSADIRHSIEATPIPDDAADAIAAEVARLGDDVAFAVRSSATAEDLPTASFAGQHDSFLNITGRAEILRHVSRCWASLLTERAVSYRRRNGIDHRSVEMAVVVQRMVLPQAAGVLFTADPVTSNRRVAVVEASHGLGEALVSGSVNPDVYRVRDGEVIARSIADEARAAAASPAGEAHVLGVEAARREQPALTDAQVLDLVQLGRRIEAHFGCPQDVEWCLVDGGFQIVQSRPITTLFPIPRAGDGENHVYVSVGHGQMMTDPMRPLGLSMFQLTAGPPMHAAAGRLFVDVTARLAAPATRAGLLDVMWRSDPLIGDALQSILDRGDFVPTVDDRIGASPAAPQPPIDPDPSLIPELIARTEASIADLKRTITSASGPELFDFVLADIQELKRLLFDPQNHQAIMAGIEATWWLNDHLGAWLGEKNAADALTRSAPGNITSEMGLALLDVADAIRPHPEVVSFLERVEDDRFLDEMGDLDGGAEARSAIAAWLDRYGMRCVGEIDITRPRWSERPSTLLPVILGNVRNFARGAGRRRLEAGHQEARTKEQELLQRLRALPDGERKAGDTKRMVDRLRTFIGYREYPKYGIVCRYFVYKHALMDEADRLVRRGVLRDREDAFHLTFQEFHEAARTDHVDHELLDRRRAEFRSYEALTPPRVLTSEGEAVAGTYRRDDLPAGALVGLAVSAGTVEGRARVVLDMAGASLEPGDIMVTTHTDPSWTPLFVTVAGLVTEVGGLMTHGAVIAREYGLPAVVGVEHATRLIPDGQRIRLDGTHGYVEILPSS